MGPFDSGSDRGAGAAAEYGAPAPDAAIDAGATPKYMAHPVDAGEQPVDAGELAIYVAVIPDQRAQAAPVPSWGRICSALKAAGDVAEVGTEVRPGAGAH